MKKIKKLFLFFCFFLFPLSSFANQPNVGKYVNGGVFLYREPVEIYWDDWIAFPLMKKESIPNSSKVRLTVIGEGKTAEFIGNLSINCLNGKHFWESAASRHRFLNSSDEADEVTPDVVIRNVVNLFCKN